MARLGRRSQPEILLDDAPEDVQARVDSFLGVLRQNPGVMVAVLQSDMRHASGETPESQALAAAESAAWGAAAPIIEHRDYYEFGYDEVTGGMIKKLVAESTGRQSREQMARGRLGVIASQELEFQETTGWRPESQTAQTDGASVVVLPAQPVQLPNEEAA